MTIRAYLSTLSLLLLAGCATVPNPFGGQPEVSKAAIGAGIGAAAGAAIGAAATRNDPRISVLIGAGVDALPGAAIGSYMDKQQDELRTQLQATGVSVTRVGNQIVLNLPSNVAFDADKAVVKPQFAATLASVGVVLKHFDQTMVNVYGYTDSQGSAEDNKNLSQRRAVAVATNLANQGVDQRRFYIEGRGAADPIATNNTDAGREQNRRVEIQLTPLTQG